MLRWTRRKIRNGEELIKKPKKQTNNMNKKKICELDGAHTKNIVYKEVLSI
jgi:hypothetical protein